MTTAAPTDGSRLISGPWSDVIVAVILSVTAVATAWSAFQASKWSGAMTVAFNDAAVDRTLAATDIAQASRDITGDRATFSSYVLALAAGDDAADIMFEEFRDEVKPLVATWAARDPLSNPGVASPFDDPAYTVAATVDMAAAELAAAEAHTDEALEARQNAGNYTLTTVMFAVVLFLAGLSRQFESRLVTMTLAAVALVILVVGIGLLVALPTVV